MFSLGESNIIRFTARSQTCARIPIHCAASSSVIPSPPTDGKGTYNISYRCLAELTDTKHKMNDTILHYKTKVFEIEQSIFRKEREAYWKDSYDELTKN